MTKWWTGEPDPRTQPPVERRTFQNRRKSTRRWCKGKVGVEHTPEVVRHHAYEAGVFLGRVCHWTEWRNIATQRWVCYHAERCTTCGKYADVDLGTGRCPDYDGSPNPGNIRI